MAKNIVICCDGTGNEFGESKSNVVNLYKLLVHDDSQVAYYHPGVGTMGARSALTGITRWWTKVIGLAFGYGISDNIADAYQFLMRTFEPDDKVYVFGFSRGAYTARALCGMLHIIGLLREDNEGLIPYSIRMIKQKHIDFPLAADFKKTFSRDCKPHFVGVWDTVSSVGWVYNVAHFPGTKATHNPDLRIIRHAVSIDERRAFFRQNLFGAPYDAQQDIRKSGLLECTQTLVAAIPSQRASFPRSLCSGWPVRRKLRVFELTRIAKPISSEVNHRTWRLTRLQRISTNHSRVRGGLLSFGRRYSPMRCPYQDKRP